MDWEMSMTGILSTDNLLTWERLICGKVYNIEIGRERVNQIPRNLNKSERLMNNSGENCCILVFNHFQREKLLNSFSPDWKKERNSQK